MTRAGSFAVQNADLLLVLGSRLTSLTTGTDFCKFARAARTIVVDIDAVEHSKGDPECVIEAVHEHLFEHTHARDRVDDQTIVALKVDV